MKYIVTPDEFVDGKFVVEHPMHGLIASCSEAEARIIWKYCPQLRDDEPRRTGRHCPLDNRDNNDA